MEILCPSASFLSNYVITFIIILKKPTLASGKFSVIGPAEPIQASLGGVAELSCYLSPSQSAQHMEVVWFHSTHVVHVYRDGEDQFGDQAPNYQGRTELKRDAITSGNVTLKIWDVRYLDSGRYMCLLSNGFHQEEADMELKVLVHSCRSFPWMRGITGILALTYSLEIQIAIFYTWLKHKCRGFQQDETSPSKDWKFEAAYLLLVVIKIISMVLPMLYIRDQRQHHSTEPVPKLTISTLPGRCLGYIESLFAEKR
ncbi:myelin-oligodendrocyte glycoprotein-like [Dromiciops gliroides]|uniref:myelin-oligodendrocyte glycoprotein-like n=1 Tax=Dromiciops gliroides TaxID=33562 RepID=UPI001CC3934B|nr:myelin-oligodendrocyte glycoprotein-like [Dromiciops gliroides]